MHRQGRHRPGTVPAVWLLRRGYNQDGPVYPRLLAYDPDRILRPKLELFASLGVRPCKIASTPVLLSRSLENQLIPCIEFLRGILGTDDEVGRAITHGLRTLMIDLDRKMRPAVEALRRLGFPEGTLPRLLIVHIGVLLNSPDRLGEIFKDLKALGLDVREPSFVYALRAMSSISKETYLRKLALFQSFGASEDELRNALRRQPSILLFSEDTVKKKLSFILDELKIEMSAVMRNPVVIGYSLERAIMPRSAVLSLLMREGKINPGINLLNALLGSVKKFSNKYVLRFADDVPDVVAAYQGKIPFQGFKRPVPL